MRQAQEIAGQGKDWIHAQKKSTKYGKSIAWDKAALRPIRCSHWAMDSDQDSRIVIVAAIVAYYVVESTSQPHDPLVERMLYLFFYKFSWNIHMCGSSRSEAADWGRALFRSIATLYNRRPRTDPNLQSSALDTLHRSQVLKKVQYDAVSYALHGRNKSQSSGMRSHGKDAFTVQKSN